MSVLIDLWPWTSGTVEVPTAAPPPPTLRAELLVDAAPAALLSVPAPATLVE